jgi:hypothetical protein
VARPLFQAVFGSQIYRFGREISKYKIYELLGLDSIMAKKFSVDRVLLAGASANPKTSRI